MAAMVEPLVQIPVFARVHLAHAVIEHLGRVAGADLLHVKGPALLPGLRDPTRSSTDVDVLVRPSHLRRLVEALEAHGWDKRTDFATGSVFAHAANWWHDDWGWADVHVSWPGAEVDPEDAFEVLAATSITAPISHVPCRVPDRTGQVLVLVLHAARSGDLSDVHHAWDGATAEEQAAVRALASRLRAQVALAAGIGELDQHRGHPSYPLWRHFRDGGNQLDLWRARLAAAPGARAKWAIARESLAVNRDHLRLELGREPEPADVRARQLLRARRGVRQLTERLRP